MLYETNKLSRKLSRLEAALDKTLHLHLTDGQELISPMAGSWESECATSPIRGSHECATMGV